MSIVGLATTIPQLVLLLFSGALSDRLPRRRLMVGADALRAVAIGMLGGLALADALSLEAIVALVVVYAVGTALFQPASISLLPQVVPPERRAQANGLMRLAGALAVRLIGPALGGGVVGAFGAGTAFLADAGTFVVSLALLLMVSAYPVPERAAKSLVADVREGLAFVRRQGWLTASLAAASIGLLCYEGPTVILLPFLIKNRFDGHASDLGFVLSAGGAGAVLAALLISHFGLPRKRMLLMYGLWTALGSSLLLYAVAGSIWQLAVVCFLAIGSMIAGEVIWITMLQDHVPHELGALHDQEALPAGVDPDELAARREVGESSPVVPPKPPGGEGDDRRAHGSSGRAALRGRADRAVWAPPRAMRRPLRCQLDV